MRNLNRVLIMSIMLISTIALGREIHVAKNGADSNSGSIDKPYLTISKAAEVAAPGDVCIIHAGTYEETLSPAKSGTPGNPIIFQSYPGDKVIISAMQAVDNWEQDEGHIYKAQVDWSLRSNNMVLNGQTVCELARWPNKIDADPFSLNWLRNSGGSNETVKTDAYLTYSKGIPEWDWSNGGILVYYCDAPGSGWTTWRATIKSSNANRVTFDLPPSWIGSAHPPSKRGDFFLQGIKEALDYANEYYFDEGSQILYIYTEDGAPPVAGQVKMRKRKSTIDLKNRSYIEIRNLAVFGGSIEITGSASNNVLSGVSSFYGNTTLGVVTHWSAGEESLNLLGHDNVIEKCEIAFGSGTGIWIGGDRNEIVNCLIHDFDFLGNYDAPIQLRGGEDVILRNNTIYRAGRDCVQYFGLYGEFAYNDVSHSNLIATDCGLLYTVGGPFYATIHHNWFHDTFSRGSLYKAAGIYLDNNAEGFDVYRNVVWNTEWASIQINLDAGDINIFNNTLWNGSRVMGAWHRSGTSFFNMNVYNNLGSDDNWEEQADKQNNLTMTSDPFVNSAAGDFRLRAGTEPIDNGVEIPGITDGFVGDAPDVGAYEFGGDEWKAGIDWDQNLGPTGLGPYGLPGEGVGPMAVQSKQSQPRHFQLLQNYPNPFNPMTTIEYTLDTPARITLAIYDVLGREIRQLENQFKPAGVYAVQWDGKDEQGLAMASGTYFYRLIVHDMSGATHTQSRKMIVLR